MFKRIPILIYHSIEPEGSKRIYEGERFYNATPEMFRKQMRYLKENGYNTITIDKLMRSATDYELPDKPIMLTFDDGHISHYETVLPILKEFGFTAAFFLVVNDIGKKYRVNWKQSKTLKDSGMDIGSHGMNHKILDGSSYFNLVSETKSSKIILEDTLRMNILAFSIPRGVYSKKISTVARGMGYMFVFTSFTGNTSIDSDPYCIKRIVMLKNYSMKDFISIVHKDPVFMIKKRLEQFAKNGIQKTIGIKGYEQIKKALFMKA
ncbi:MAG: polysaccharide deacetylase family protein [Candidatus Omnitrophica bacterium]|nr:polysaccharide deacetylase family protein [Candidatus Omnitrophota bacterium]